MALVVAVVDEVRLAICDGPGGEEAVAVRLTGDVLVTTIVRVCEIDTFGEYEIIGVCVVVTVPRTDTDDVEDTDGDLVIVAVLVGDVLAVTVLDVVADLVWVGEAESDFVLNADGVELTDIWLDLDSRGLHDVDGEPDDVRDSNTDRVGLEEDDGVLLCVIEPVGVALDLGDLLDETDPVIVLDFIEVTVGAGEEVIVREVLDERLVAGEEDDVFDAIEEYVEMSEGYAVRV